MIASAVFSPRLVHAGWTIDEAEARRSVDEAWTPGLFGCRTRRSQ